MFNVTNNGKSIQVLHDATGRAKSLAPGRTLPIELLAGQVKRYQRITDLKFVQIPGLQGEEEVWSEPVPARKASSRVRLNDVPPTPAKQAAALLTLAKDRKIEFPELLTRAKALLGDDWPGGTPKKSVIVGALGGLAKSSA